MLLPSVLGADDKFGPIRLGLATATAVVTFFSVCKKSPPPDGVIPVSFLPGIPLLGNTLEMVANIPRIQDWISDQFQERNGNPIGARLVGKNKLIYLAKPEHFEQVLKTQSSNFSKGIDVHVVFSDFMGNGILLVNGDRWKYHRKVLVNLFSARAMREFMTPVVQKNVHVLMEILSNASDTGKEIDIYRLMNKFTFETFTEIGFGQQLGNLKSIEDHPFEVAFDEAHYICTERFSYPVWLWKLKRWLNVGSERLLRDSMVVINEYLMETISTAMKRREQGHSRSNYVPSMDEVQDLPYLEATIREVLRLVPSVPIIPYHCYHDTVFPDGTFIPADSAVLLSTYSTARLECVWGPDASSFVPERFLDPKTGELLKMSSTEFVAFSAGSRVCVGRNLAMLELKLVLSCLVSYFRLVEVNGQDVTYGNGVTIRMKNPLMMKVETVSNTSA
ncbi:cytochrome P450, putative [Phytophthora infestans T30-4]|uniref:Cytochrome P450, putative n=1 Tax=Phytophthora infestans (strain T30-4) TaxID=403677 RepID=D0NPQ4_PHYIT|nr:cytochrome P450, putative [Phytophthora infestans T30-4]EEY62616.1 cytochrome P450, putative [Phytophthora infestans T30-4]|eukprot:XP_002898858.1 cytochrome P450, putative [Phytophthora infestans T30-4]